MSQKTALITGITGQDGAYLAELLLGKGYTVHGIKRRSSSFNTGRIDNLYQDPHVNNRNFVLHYGDLSDSTNLIRIVQEVQPDELYNLAAQSHVKVSFETPEYTANSDALGTLRLLEAIRILGLEAKTRFYQASTSELYGKVRETPQNEGTPFYPRSPYAVAKLYAYWITINYREAYGLYASNGILFNHESPLRGETFVTRKITRAAAATPSGGTWMRSTSSNDCCNSSRTVRAACFFVVKNSSMSTDAIHVHLSFNGCTKRVKSPPWSFVSRTRRDSTRGKAETFTWSAVESSMMKMRSAPSLS